ncbi:uncharacterized protein LOC118198511 [Stegodyphus dumicola]|uniref:uncharacterized protein LOC118198511 n=1 Tax=Stegodyphus dumicola TaxID=202533 RepID=UPI0015B2DDA7|nr:uncharacterized protein LOC118198511 [Stegodyphus dumicola]
MALNRVVSFVSKFKQHKHVVILSLDFDSISWSSLLHYMIDLELPLDIVRRYASYFTNRYVLYNEFFDDSDCVTLQIFKGCPQGSCSATLFWNLIMNKLLNFDFHEEDMELVAYADDILIFLKEDSLEKLEALFDRITPYFDKWKTEENLTFCMNKTNALFFPKCGRKCRTPQLRYNGCRIKFVQSLKYLGVIFDSGLTFSEHFKIIQRRTDNIFLFYKRYFTTCVLSSKYRIILDIHKKVIIPIVMYGMGAWGSRAGELQRIRLKLNTIQRSWCLLITRCFRTVSSEVLCVLAGTPPLSILYQMYYDRFLLRSGNLDFKIFGNELLTRHAYDKFNRLLFHPAKNVMCTFDKILPRNNMYEIYTDGSGIDNSIGAAFVVYFYGVETDYSLYKLNKYNSVFQAESCALEQALSYVHHNLPPRSVIDIYSDCLSLLQNLQNPIVSNFTLYNIKCLHKNILCLSSLRLHWIKVHVGFDGNERADALDAARSDDIPYIEISGSRRYGRNGRNGRYGRYGRNGMEERLEHLGEEQGLLKTHRH